MCNRPKAPPVPPPPPEAPKRVDAAVTGAYGTEKRRQRAAAGQSSTILSGPMGSTGTANVGKTILGG